MKFTFAFATFVLAAVALARPVARDATPTDIDILNFALTLEHLENAFYTKGLDKYTEQDFIDAGFEPWVHGRMKNIAAHEATHVEFLEDALGDKAVQPDIYNFPDTDPKSFIDTSFALETVGTSAYTGAAKLIENKDYLTAATSILATEARQAAWVNSAARHGNPWNTAFETPLDMNQVYTLASAFIASSPASNPAIPAKAFPSLTFPASALPGQTVTLGFDAAPSSSQLYAAFISGLDTVFVPLTPAQGGKWQSTIPGDLIGVVFVMVTKDNKSVVDDNTVAGPAMVSFPFDSDGKVEVLNL